jgi:hypothetical protein
MAIGKYKYKQTTVSDDENYKMKCFTLYC